MPTVMSTEANAPDATSGRSNRAEGEQTWKGGLDALRDLRSRFVNPLDLPIVKRFNEVDASFTAATKDAALAALGAVNKALNGRSDEARAEIGEGLKDLGAKAREFGLRMKEYVSSSFNKGREHEASASTTETRDPEEQNDFRAKAGHAFTSLRQKLTEFFDSARKDLGASSTEQQLRRVDQVSEEGLRQTLRALVKAEHIPVDEKARINLQVLEVLKNARDVVREKSVEGAPEITPNEQRQFEKELKERFKALENATRKLDESYAKGERAQR